MCFWRALWPIFRFYARLAATVSCCWSWMTMDFDADHTASSASPGCCMWWCRQDACPHERSGSGGRSTSSQALLFWTWRFRGLQAADKHAASAKSEGFSTLWRAPFKNSNCRKCCRSWGCFTVRRGYMHICGEKPRQRCMESDASLLSRRENTQD